MKLHAICIDKSRGKKEIIRSYCLGKKITNIERKFGVSRFSVHTWSRMVDEAITIILKDRDHTNKIEELESEVKDFKKTLVFEQKI